MYLVPYHMQGANTVNNLLKKAQTPMVRSKVSDSSTESYGGQRAADGSDDGIEVSSANITSARL